jgi:hypothetical protein
MIVFFVFVALVGIGFLFSKFVDNAVAWGPVLILGPLFFLSVLGGLYGMFQMLAGDRPFSGRNISELLACAFFALILVNPVLGGFEWFERLGKARKSESVEREDIGRPARHDDSVGGASSAGVKGPSVYVKCPYCAVTLSFNESWIRSQNSVICKDCGNNATVALVGNLGIKLRSPQG